MPIAGQILLLVICFIFTAGFYAAGKMAQASEGIAERFVWWGVLGLNAMFGLACFALLMSSNDDTSEERE